MRLGAGAVVDVLSARIRHAELAARDFEDAMLEHQRDHTHLQGEVRRLEAELAELRANRIEAYARWWNARDDRDRQLHIARRLRRRLDRVQRRGRSVTGRAEGCEGC
ncbi:hypothetical protein DEF23_16185 [Marinitenerispora sediminis]|uniref:Uncharacterized protein n=1 Tax=Marinitenerispora sediminis TaxID=1931232 RepID=A0A368SZR0_9ACTN|nr:hypothetical protein DEF24_23520 [Marinitenerispora sediminis]RCV52760.1 hypothetical protein DEF28_12400 [Marinitenerispora sediminis]RCV54264.1 hypothetical protein DEF23_16185 [Marinitenerispora sediminis]